MFQWGLALNGAGIVSFLGVAGTPDILPIRGQYAVLIM